MTWSSVYFLQIQSQLTGLWGPWDRSTRFWCPRNQVKYKWVISAQNNSEGTGQAWKLLHGEKTDPKWRREYWKLIKCQKLKTTHIHAHQVIPSIHVAFSPIVSFLHSDSEGLSLPMAWFVCCSNHRDIWVITCNPSGWQTLLMLWSILTRFQVSELDPPILFKTSVKWWALSTDSYQTQPSLSSLYVQIIIQREAFSVGTDKTSWLSHVKKVSKNWIRIKRCFPIRTVRGKGKVPKIRKKNGTKPVKFRDNPAKTSWSELILELRLNESAKLSSKGS